MSFFIGYIAAAIAVGALAQFWKRRAGIGWAALTFLPFFFWYSVAERVERPPDTTDGVINASNAMFGFLFAFGTMLIIVATLRRRPVVEVDNRQIQNAKKCPMCAEDIRREAVVCRFCGHKFGVANEPQRLEPRL